MIDNLADTLNKLIGECRCIDGYKDRGLTDPQCVRCECEDDVVEYIKEKERQLAAQAEELAKARDDAASSAECLDMIRETMDAIEGKEAPCNPPYMYNDRLRSIYAKLAAENERLKGAAQALIREIVWEHPGTTGFTVLMDHEPLYALALLVNGECTTREGEKRTTKYADTKGA